MSFLNKIRNHFNSEEKTIIAPDSELGEVVPIESPNDKVLMLPCPFQFQLTKACICMTCNFLFKNCPMEKLCQNTGCSQSFIGACTNYTNDEDMNSNEKRKIFREGATFDGRIVFFGGKSKTDTPV